MGRVMELADMAGSRFNVVCILRYKLFPKEVQRKLRAGSSPAEAHHLTTKGFIMGTRADFYIGRGENSKWIGSIAWDGYPDGIPDDLLASETVDDFTKAVNSFFSDRDDVTLPDMGWPWPWETSHTTDFVYAIDGGKVWASCFGSNWFDPAVIDDDGNRSETDMPAVFPVFSRDRYAEAGTNRSGVIIIG